MLSFPLVSIHTNLCTRVFNVQHGLITADLPATSISQVSSMLADIRISMGILALWILYAGIVYSRHQELNKTHRLIVNKTTIPSF